MTYRLRFANLGREIAASADDTLYQSARRGGVRIVGACGGRGACGTCVVRVVEGEVELTEEDGEPAERESLRDRQWVRACRVHARSDCTVEVAPRSLAPVVRADMASLRSGTLALDPAVRQRELVLAPATLDDPVADLDRVARALDCDTLSACDAAAARQLPGILRAHAWRLRARLHGGEAIGFAAPGSRALGLAVDLGTTNVAAFLIDLDSGIQLASLGIENPQAAWGADVISRLNFASRSSAGGDELRAAAVAGINALAADLCEAVGVHGEDIVDLALCGNTAMHHLLLGLPVHQLGHAPFVAVLRDSLDIKARELGIRACAGAYVHIAPGVGGFVGGDHVAALLGTEEIWSNAKLSILMDIGTNTEISLIHHGEILTASCPSGPALEGGHISCGMRAAEGAIERVRLSDGRIAVQTIGGGKAVGVCGSGVLDAVATLHAAGIVDARGRIVEEHAAVRAGPGKREAVLAPGVSFTQDDVRAVQLAKSAIRTGVDLLLAQAGLAESAIERFIIAGAFGAYLHVPSGVAIGLFPDLPAERFIQVGNAAGDGVRQMLASTRARTRARTLSARCRYVELSKIGNFQKTFLYRIAFN